MKCMWCWNQDGWLGIDVSNLPEIWWGEEPVSAPVYLSGMTWPSVLQVWPPVLSSSWPSGLLCSSHYLFPPKFFTTEHFLHAQQELRLREGMKSCLRPHGWKVESFAIQVVGWEIGLSWIPQSRIKCSLKRKYQDEGCRAGQSTFLQQPCSLRPSCPSLSSAHWVLCDKGLARMETWKDLVMIL